MSPVTVSRVINNSGSVSAATREKVERAIEELGYVPSVMARSLRSKRTRTLALIVSDVTNPFWTTVARGVEDAAQGRDYSVFLYNTDENPVKQQRCLDVVVAQRVDGVIIAPYDSDARNLAKLRAQDVPTVAVDRRLDGWDVDSVYSDSVSGAKAGVQHLIGLGHTRIAVITGPASTSTAQDRVVGYCLALSEAGIPVDPRLIKQGEYRVPSGEELTCRLLDEGPAPTAIFAANNAIAMGVIQGLGKRGLRVPQDVALVCFDDLPYVSRLFPFLTVVVQSAYDLGVNAAQLLLSRLDSEVNLQPRHVVLPTRLIVRHSCGSTLRDSGHGVLSLPMPEDAFVEEISIVKPLSPDERASCAGLVTGLTVATPRKRGGMTDYERSDVNRLLAVLQHREADRVPHLELSVTSRDVYEYVLERELKVNGADLTAGGQSITPEEQVEFAVRLGMDAVRCDFLWRLGPPLEPSALRPGAAPVKTVADLDDLELPPSLADQLSTLERYLRAAQGTGVGIIANFSSFFGVALSATGGVESHGISHHRRSLLERLMDLLLDHQERVMRVVCDRFANDLAFVMISEDIADDAGLVVDRDVWESLFSPRMDRLIAPAKEHGKLVAVHAPGKVVDILPVLYDVGFDAVHPVEPGTNDLFQLKGKWTNRMALVGGIPPALLAHGNDSAIEQKVREYCIRLAPGGGYVFGSSGEIGKGTPPENFVAMTRAVHKYGRYGALGEEN